ncbi:MAG: hypothetical protein LJE96_03750 [Deltaproteobacteria bacterium]|nr:hypothetical protein [Deltaproteobacteria bacterium]
MCHYVKKTCKYVVAVILLALMSGAWTQVSASALFETVAQDPRPIQTVRDIASSPLERISPVVMAYHRLKAVLTAHANSEKIPFILPVITHALSNPLALPTLVCQLTDPTYDFILHHGTGNRVPNPNRLLQAFASRAAKVLPSQLDFEDPIIASFGETKKTMSIETLTNGMAAQIATACRLVDEAFSGISLEEKTRLLKLVPHAMNEFFENGNLSDRDAFYIMASAKRIHMANLLKGVYELSNLFSNDFLALIRQAGLTAPEIPVDHIKYPGLRGRFLMIRETPAGLMLIGGPGPNVYGTNASLIVDLGGDDLYMNNAGAPIYELGERGEFKIYHPVAMVVDFEGDDRYLNRRFAAIASGFFGLGVILDMEGNDFYDGGQLSLGAAFFGMGCLMDLAGNDTYVSSEGGQGTALFGAALLFDGQGDDLYQGAEYVQGVGGPMGFGELFDARGNDHYRAGWKYGSSYGTKGIYQGCSQGVGWGFRRHAAGGIGIVHDSAGDDVYEADNFSQGTGYYLGLGALRDDTGHDVYRGSRYCQGSAAHQAAGVLLDFDGDDAYSGKIAANQGAAWDLSAACLVDYAGDDSYKADDLSLGAGAQNGMGMFFDGNGSDRYDSPKRSLGFSGDLSYGGGRNAGNMGIFLDMGNGRDFFTVEDRKNGLFLIQGNLGIFLDE